MDATFIFGVLSLLCAGIAIVQTWRFNKYQRKVNESLRVFDVPNVSFYFYGNTNKDLLVFNLPLDLADVFEVPLFINVVNSGEKTAEDVEIYIRIPKELMYQGLGELLPEENIEEKININRISRDGAFFVYLMHIAEIHPGQHIILNILLSIRQPTMSFRAIKVSFSDRQTGEVHYLLEADFTVDVTCHYKDQKPLSGRMSIQIMDSSKMSAKEFFTEYNKVAQKEVARLKHELIKDRGFFGKYYLLIKDLWKNRNKATSREMAIFFVDDSKITFEKHGAGKKVIKIGRISKDALSYYEGVRFTNGYWVPGLNIRAFWNQ